TSPENCSGSDYNYIYTVTPQIPMSEATFIANEAVLTNFEALKNITYFDGLGRPMQAIAIGQGGQGKDIITHIGYDGIGRQDKDYLPYTDYGNTKNYRALNPEGATNDYYTAHFPTDLGVIPNPYSQ